ncbi:MAG: BACON domain-containing protein, partial [Bacteroidales bacterium]|nr:BACON domain-containing protein [Bacteroidales bacterium]
MKKYLILLLSAALALAACTPEVNPGNEVKEYAGSRASVELSTTDRLPAEGGTLIAKVHRSPEFTVSVPKTADWLSVSQADSTVTVNVKANSSAVARAAHLSIIDKELNISVTSFDVVQLGTEKEVVRKNFQISTQSLLAKADDTSASFTITSEV